MAQLLARDLGVKVEFVEMERFDHVAELTGDGPR